MKESTMWNEALKFAALIAAIAILQAIIYGLCIPHIPH
jgi:hypothetical protein